MPGLRPEEQKEAQHTEQIVQLAQHPHAQEAEHPQGGGKDAEILHLEGDDEEEQHLQLRVKHGKGQQKGEGQAVGIGRACQQAGQPRACHPQQDVEVEAEIAPLPFQRTADEPGKIDAQHHAERPAARKRHQHKGEQPPDLPGEQGTAAQGEIKGNILVDEQFNGVDQDLAADEDVDEIGNAEPAVFPFQLGDPVHRQKPPLFVKFAPRWPGTLSFFIVP